jgi:hypothetical protein
VRLTPAHVHEAAQHRCADKYNLYALWLFRGLLNGNIQFHNADGLINGLIFLYAAMVVLQLAGYVLFRYLMPDAADWGQILQQIRSNSLSIILIGMIVLVWIAASIFWIVFALRIIRLRIACGECFALSPSRLLWLDPYALH